MLARVDLISNGDRDAIVKGLSEILAEIDAGTFVFRPECEDIHMNIERALEEKIGETAGKLHTARSRNDQVALDERLWLRDEIDTVVRNLLGVQAALVELADKYCDDVMPGYTHMQRAQPVLLGHHLLAYYDMLARDRGRLADCLVRTDVLPLGAGAIAGTTLPIDRSFVAKALGFARVAENSMDAVSDRDFIVELLAAAAILFAHLSRLAGEVVLWATSEYGFVTLHDAYSTGSSMMPQKKNPDIAELVRGKSGRVYGNLVSLLTTMKGLPLAYNSDLQEDKEPLFDTVDTANASLRTLAAMIRSLRFNTARMKDAASDGFLLATDLAEYLVAAGTPFREAHEITGRIVLHCLERGVSPTDLSLDEFRKFSKDFSRDLLALLTAEQAVARRKSVGGTSGANVRRRLAELKKKK
jgi:argininosuccinate lyase